MTAVTQLGVIKALWLLTVAALGPAIIFTSFIAVIRMFSNASLQTIITEFATTLQLAIVFGSLPGLVAGVALLGMRVFMGRLTIFHALGCAVVGAIMIHINAILVAVAEGGSWKPADNMALLVALSLSVSFLIVIFLWAIRHILGLGVSSDG